MEHNPFPPHGKIEKAIKAAGLPYCFVRPSFFMQNISGVHALEIREFDRIVVPVKKALTSFIDAEDIGALVAKVLCEADRHINTAYSITGPEAINYDQVAEILTKVLGRTITYANPSPAFAKQYWLEVRRLKKDYVSVVSMLYLITRMGNAKQVTDVFEHVTGRKPHSFAEFAEKNKGAWIKSNGGGNMQKPLPNFISDEQEQRRRLVSEKIVRLGMDEITVNLRFLDGALHRLSPAASERLNFGTDGLRLYYEPGAVIERYQSDMNAVNRAVLHTLLHAVLCHHLTGSGVDKTRWDLACDLTVEKQIDALSLSAFQLREEIDEPELARQIEADCAELTAENV